MNLPRAVKCSVLIVVVIAMATVSAADPGAAWPLSWGGLAARGGVLVEGLVHRHGVEIVRSLCLRRPVAVRHLVRWVSPFARPAAESRVVGLYRDDLDELWVPDLAWTRWALDLSPAYREAVCTAGGRPGRADGVLRRAWRALLGIPDQRTRDEASRLATDFPRWATDLDDTELELLIAGWVRFSVADEEQLRWIRFVARIPPGERLLALLRVIEASRRPFFRTLQQTLAQLWRDDPTFHRFCRRLEVGSRPALCEPRGGGKGL